MRSAVIPAAVGVLVFVPLLVTQTNDEPAAPDPRAAALKLGLDSAEDKLLFVKGNGAPPTPETTFALRDETGLKTATVTPLAAADCAGKALRSTAAEGGTAQRNWCLKLSDVDAGAELTGTLKGARAGTDESTALALTVTRKDKFVGFPLVILVLGLAAGLIGALSGRIKEGAQHVRLAVLLRSNRQAKVDKRITGLAGWVAQRLAAGAPVADVAGTTSAIINGGPDRAREVRAELKQSIATAREAKLGCTAFLDAAQRVSEKTGLPWRDFVAADGSPVDHPATKWTDGLSMMTTHGATLERQKERIAALPESARTEPAKRLKEAEFEFAAIDDPARVAQMDEPLDALNDAIRSAGAGATPSISRATGEDAEPTLRGGVPARFMAALPRAALPSLKTLAVLITIVGVAVVVALAVIPVYMTGYDDKDTFHSWQDYFTLGTAALASGAASAALGVLGYWKLTAPAANAD